uniref:Putative tick transposon n=1 Tax=Amblyomma sculptum TaxID=1581419 RepID=A0A1E1XT66_AMBSC
MDPNLHRGRREARAEFIEKTYAPQATAVYTDASWRGGDTKIAVAAVVDSSLREMTSASLRGCTAAESEEVAVALAVAEGYRTGRSLTILTDSQTACRNYMNGRIGRHALRILLAASDRIKNQEEQNDKIPHKIVWVPGHTGVAGNQEADRIARGYITFRASDETAELAPAPREYSAILQNYRGRRMRYPPPHISLSREEAVTWRQLQTGSFPNLHMLNKMHPTIYTDKCPWCDEKPTLYHITWACQNIHVVPKIQNPSAEQWETLLSSDRCEDRQGLVQRAQRAAVASGALD